MYYIGTHSPALINAEAKMEEDDPGPKCCYQISDQERIASVFSVAISYLTKASESQLCDLESQTTT